MNPMIPFGARPNITDITASSSMGSTMDGAASLPATTGLSPGKKPRMTTVSRYAAVISALHSSTAGPIQLAAAERDSAPGPGTTC